jgi:hypothetical protein
MLRSMQDLKTYTIGATDGPIGHVTDFYFDDERWVIRYLVVESGSWLASRKVLISPMSIGHPDWAKKSLPVAISRDQVKGSPDIDTDKPVSRQQEIDYLGYYDYPYYWEGAGLWGAGAYPNLTTPGNAGFLAIERPLLPPGAKDSTLGEVGRHEHDDLHLRSGLAVTGHETQAVDGSIGHVSGFLVDEETWAIRYLVVDTSNWWIGHQVLVPPQWVTGVSWPKREVSVHLDRDKVKFAPPYDPALPLDREKENAIYSHYGRPAYWTAPEPAKCAA